MRIYLIYTINRDVHSYRDERPEQKAKHSEQKNGQHSQFFLILKD